MVRHERRLVGLYRNDKVGKMIEIGIGFVVGVCVAAALVVWAAGALP